MVIVGIIGVVAWQWEQSEAKRVLVPPEVEQR